MAEPEQFEVLILGSGQGAGHAREWSHSNFKNAHFCGRQHSIRLSAMCFGRILSGAKLRAERQHERSRAHQRPQKSGYPHLSQWPP